MRTMAIFTLKINAMTKYSDFSCLEYFECRKDAVESLKECKERFVSRNPGNWDGEDTEDTIYIRHDLYYFDGSVRETAIIPKGGSVIAECGTIMRCNENKDIYAKLGSTVTSLSTGMKISHPINVREKRRIRNDEFDENFTWTGVGCEEAETYRNAFSVVLDAEFKARYNK